MYLRRNKVRCGETRRTYLSIAHNVWWSGDGARKAQSRPIVVASFGSEEKVDVELARELVVAVEQSAPRMSVRRGHSREATMRLAKEIRRIEPFLKMLASRKLGLSEVLPHGHERATVLEALVRAKLAEPDAPTGEEDVLRTIRSVAVSATM